ncbi:MAG TPA: cytochrome P450 [Acidimicrobiia bacterium]|nr:cytochrome P450 [Acidimicrobiia bacterium]
MTDTATEPKYLLRGGDLWRNPWDDYRRLRDQSPVHRVEHPEYGEFFVLSRFSDVFDAVRDTETFSSARGLTLDPDAMAIFEGRAAPIVMMDPPDHTTMRRLVGRPMTPRAVATTEPEITAFVDARLEEIEDAGGEVDVIEALFKPLPSWIVALYLGVPTEDRARFDAWTDAIVAANASGEMTSAADAFASLFDYGNQLIELRRREPGDDLVSDLVRAGEERADAFWIVGFVFTMVTGGNDTTTGLLGGAADLLTEYRDQRRILLDDPARIRWSVDELLRLTTPVQNLARTTTRDVHVGNTVIPHDRKVMLLFGSANRDEREFEPNAGELDVTRTIDKIVSFGYGAHHCLGATAARHAAGIALERLLERFPDFEVDPARGRYAPGPFVRRYEQLPFVAHG